MTHPDPRVICRECSHWNPCKVSSAMASMGFGHCAAISVTSWHTFNGSFKHLCAHHQRAPDETIAARERLAAAHDQPQPEKAKP